MAQRESAATAVENVAIGLVADEDRQPAIDFERAGGVDLERLARSLHLRGHRVGVGRYRVSGGSHEHWVDLYSSSHPRCDCGDHLWRERVCKHILAALLREGNERVVSALGQLFAELRTAAQAA
jgi:hypothetical protein